MKTLNVWVNVVILNSPPYIPIPFSNALILKALNPIIVEKIKITMATLENSIDLSRLTVTALETNKKINDSINNKINMYSLCY